MNDNLTRAREYLSGENYTCVFCRGASLFADTRRGIRPLLDLIDQAQNLRGFAAADKVVGKAAALLYCRMGITHVYAPVISTPAIAVLERNGICLQYDQAVPAIFNRDRTDLCPMEKAVRHIDDPAAALDAIRTALAQLQK